jgi:hypothetical protein
VNTQAQVQGWVHIRSVDILGAARVGARDFAESAPDASRVNYNDIPYITAANDNFRVKDRLSARCGALLRRLIGLHSGSWPN